MPTTIEEAQDSAGVTGTRFPPPSDLVREDLDDGWGPPGTTIPPPFLGAIPGTEPGRASSQIPLVVDDDISGEHTVPLLTPLASPRVLTADAAPIESASAEASLTPTRAIVEDLQHDLEAASMRLLDLVHLLDAASSRDAVVDALVEHLADSHHQVAFFAIKPTEISVWKQHPPGASLASLSLERPSLFQDVVRSRLPFHGAPDEVARTYAVTVLGGSPDRVLALPVTVKGRVVGVLYGHGRHRHVFDAQLAVVARAAGVALERILLAKKTP